MIERHESPAETPGLNQLSYPIPNPVDLVVIEYVDARPQHYKPIEIDTPHPENARTGLNLKLTWQGPSSADPEKMVRVYTTGRTNQDVYNFAIDYSGESNAGPIFVRSYLERRDTYTALPKKLPLTGVTSLRLTSGGSGYGSNPTVEITGTGTGAAAEAVVIDGVVVAIRLTSEGIDYSEAPTIELVGGGGAGATAVAAIQPASAVLIKEEVKKIVDEVPEMNRQWNEAMLGGLFVRVIRVYETLPGPWIISGRWDDNLGKVFIQKRSVLTTEPPQEASSTATTKTVFEAREGSSIVSIQTDEFWGDAPYDHEFSIDVSDPVPAEFRDLVPTRTSAQTEVGIAAPPELAPGETARSSREVNKFWRHESVTARDLTLLPVTRIDYELDGIQAGGSEFGGVFSNTRTLDLGPQSVQEGFEITKSSVKQLGNGLTLRETKRLSGALPARLLLTFPGSGFGSPPAVVFGAGNTGAGATGTPVLSTAPVIPPEGEPGGTFDLDLVDYGDNRGVFYFLGARYGGGAWRNPATAGNIAITAASSPTYPLSGQTLARVVDRSAAASVTVIPQEGGGHYIAFDLGVGKRLKANRITIRQADPRSSGTIMRNLRVEGFNDFVTGFELGDAPIPQNAGEWSQAPLDDSVGFRYFRVFGTDDAIPGLTPTTFPALALGEIEFYGELEIVPGIVKQYSFDGDTNGVFHDLAARANGGVWRNPQTNNDIVVNADALVTGTVDLIVDREQSNVVQDASPSARSYYFDLKEGRSLICSKMSFRQRNLGATAADVQLQGTNDPAFVTSDWTALASFIAPTSANTWKTIDVPASGGYRRFRLVSQTDNFAIGELELYGALTFPPETVPDPTFSIESINVTAPGTNYAVPPAVIIEGDGTGAAGTAVLNDEGGVESVLMTNHGSGYTEATVRFAGVGALGTGAAATATINGAVTAINVDDGGSLYEVPPDVVIGAETGGTGAAADAVLGFAIASIDVDTGGTGFTIEPDVIIEAPTGDGGAQATAHALLTGDVVTSIVIDDPGFGYLTTPGVTLDGDGTGATATANLETAGSVNRVDVTAGGSNYQGAPAITFEPVGADPGSGAIAQSVIEGPISGFVLSDGGQGYEVAPLVQIPGDGTATAQIESGVVTGLTLGTPGSYDEPPPVVFAPVGGPEGEATIAFGIDHITVNNGGSGYAVEPPVQIDGDGRSASARAILGRSLASIEVVAPGDDYASDITVGISAPDGVGGATASAQRSFGIASATVGAGGTGYTSDPDVTAVAPAGGTDAILRAIRGLPLREVLMTNPGQDYDTAPTVGFAAPFPVVGTTAVGTAVLGFGVDEIEMDTMGASYQTAPQVRVVSPASGGGGCTAIAELLGKTLASIFVDNGGTGFTSEPTIIVGDGSNATAHAVLTGDVITSIVVDTPGSGYLVAPEIYILNDGGGSGAHAQAVLSAGQDIRVVVTNPGAGYEAAPTVEFIGGGGTGAAATATLLATGGVKRVVLSNDGTDYTIDTPVTFTPVGTGSGAVGTAVRDLEAAGPVALIAVIQAGAGYIATTINCVFSGGGGSGATATATKKTLGSIKSITVTNIGGGFEAPPVISITQGVGGIGAGVVLRAILAPTGKVKRVDMNSAGEGYVEIPEVSFPAQDGTGAVATAVLKETGSIETLTLTVPGGPFSVAPLVSFVPPGDAPLATALYLLAQVWPTLIDEITDATDKLVVQVIKDIMPYGTALPPGYAEMQALNKYRSIQIVSKLDLHRMPPAETYLTTQHVGLPNQLLGVIPVWSARVAENSSTDGKGTSGDAGATAEVHGSILVLKTGGFRGAALARVERVWFNGPPPDSSIPTPTIIRPSTGTAFLRGGANSVSRTGALIGQLLNINGQPAQIGDLIGYNAEGQPIIYGGGSDPSYGIRSGSSSSLGSSLQIVDISDILTAGLNTASVNGIVQESGAGNAGALNVHAEVQGTFGVNMPPSCPASLQPGSAILQEVAVAKRRFNLYVREIIYVIVPGICEAVGGDSGGS